MEGPKTSAEVAEEVRKGNFFWGKPPSMRTESWKEVMCLYNKETKEYGGYLQCSRCRKLIKHRRNGQTSHLVRHRRKCVPKRVWKAEENPPEPQFTSLQSAHRVNLKSVVQELWLHQKHCDVNIWCMGSSVPIQCHEVILATYSHFFEGLLSENSSSRVAEDTQSIILPDVPHESVIRLLELCYLGYTNVRGDQLTDLKNIASWLSMDPLLTPLQEGDEMWKNLQREPVREDSNHSTDQHVTASFPCSTCSMSFPNAVELEIHKSAGHNTVLKCPDCSRPMPSVFSLKKHMQRSHPKVQFACRFCFKLFKRKDFLKAHLQTSHRVFEAGENFFCNICNRGFRRKQALQSHREMEHWEDERFQSELKAKAISCPKCPKQFLLAKACRDHIRSTHVSVRNHACSTCRRSFKTARALRAHEALHSSKQYQCLLCQKPFGRLDYVQKHVRNVHGEADSRRLIGKFEGDGRTVISVDEALRLIDMSEAGKSADEDGNRGTMNSKDN